jgi:hypothetical protein
MARRRELRSSWWRTTEQLLAAATEKAHKEEVRVWQQSREAVQVGGLGAASLVVHHTPVCAC